MQLCGSLSILWHGLSLGFTMWVSWGKNQNTDKVVFFLEDLGRKCFFLLFQLLESVHSVYMFEMWFIHLKWGFKLLNVEANQTSAWDWYSRPTFSCTGFIHEGIIFFWSHLPMWQSPRKQHSHLPYLQVTPSQKVCCQPKLPFYIWVSKNV